MKKLIVVNPKERLSAAEILAHPWIKDVQSSQVLSHKGGQSIAHRLSLFRAATRIKFKGGMLAMKAAAAFEDAGKEHRLKDAALKVASSRTSKDASGK